MQYDDCAFWQCFQCRQHAVEIEPMCFRVVIRVLVDLEAGALKDTPMVCPAGVADDNFGVGLNVSQEVGTDFKGACAAQGLNGKGAPGNGQFVVLAK